MLPRIIFSVVLVFFLQGQVRCQSSPRVTGSYKAYGEMVETLEDASGIVTQIAFEESYDAETQNAAFVIWENGFNVSFIENAKTNQTYRYMNGESCDLMTIQEWIKTKSPPSLMGYEDTKGTVRFSLKQLLSLDDKYLKERNMPDKFRDIPARKWMFELPGTDSDGRKSVISVYAYWSDGSWNVTSSKKVAPIGFIVTKVVYERNKPIVKVHEQYINVFGFLHDTFDRKVFEPVQGIVCPNRVQTLPFPSVNQWQALAIHSELLFPDYQEIRYVDTYYLPQARQVRVDYERIKGQDDPIVARKQRKYQSETAIGKMGVVFRLTYDKGLAMCKVIPFKDYELDIQNLINFKLPLREWRMDKAFGLNETTYVYTGKTSKRDIPCHVFQGIRKDWPEPSAKVTSLWEWCFNINMTKKGDRVLFRNKEVGLINAQVKILQSGKQSDYPQGFRMIHHFYDIEAKAPEVMDATDFDISRCFNETQKRALQFTVSEKITDENRVMIENATSDPVFLRRWKFAIYVYSGLESYTLRISKVSSTIINGKLVVKFLILGPHPGLPKEILANQKTAFDAENTLRDNINGNQVSIQYRPLNGRLLRFFPEPHSLQFQLNRTFIPHTTPPTMPTSPSATGFVFSLRTEPHDKDKTTPPVVGSDATGDGRSSLSTGIGETTTDNGQVSSTPIAEKQKAKKVLHKSGTVAGVAVALLLVGITVGSAGTFYKYHGLPSCMRGAA